MALSLNLVGLCLATALSAPSLQAQESAEPAAVSTPSLFIGDLNRNGKLDDNDREMVMTWITRWKDFGNKTFEQAPKMEDGLVCGDFDQDGRVCDYFDKKLYNFFNLDTDNGQKTNPLTRAETESALQADLNFDLRWDSIDLRMFEILKEIYNGQAAVPLPDLNKEYAELRKLDFDVNKHYEHGQGMPLLADFINAHPIIQSASLASLLTIASRPGDNDFKRTGYLSYSEPGHIIQVLLYSPIPQEDSLATRDTAHMALTAELIADSLWSHPISTGKAMQSAYEQGLVVATLDQAIARALSASVLRHPDDFYEQSHYEHAGADGGQYPKNGNIFESPFRKPLELYRTDDEPYSSYPIRYLENYALIANTQDKTHPWSGKKLYMAWPLLLTDRPLYSMLMWKDFAKMQELGKALIDDKILPVVETYPSNLLQERLDRFASINEQYNRSIQNIPSPQPEVSAEEMQYAYFLQRYAAGDTLARQLPPYFNWARNNPNKKPVEGPSMSRALPGEDNPGFFQGIKEWFSPPPPPPAPGMYQWLSDSIETANYTDRKKGQELLTMAIEIAKKESPDEMHNMLSMRSYISSLLLIHPFLDQGMKRQIYDFDLAQAIAIADEQQRKHALQQVAALAMADITSIGKESDRAAWSSYWKPAADLIESLQKLGSVGEEIWNNSIIELSVAGLPQQVASNSDTPSKWVRDRLAKTSRQLDKGDSGSTAKGLLHNNALLLQSLAQLYNLDENTRLTAFNDFQERLGLLNETTSAENGGIIFSDGNESYYVAHSNGSLIRMWDGELSTPTTPETERQRQMATLMALAKETALKNPNVDEVSLKKMLENGMYTIEPGFQMRLELLLGQSEDNFVFLGWFLKASDGATGVFGHQNQFENLRDLQKAYWTHRAADDLSKPLSIVWEHNGKTEKLDYDAYGYPIAGHKIGDYYWYLKNKSEYFTDMDIYKVYDHPTQVAKDRTDTTVRLARNFRPSERDKEFVVDAVDVNDMSKEEYVETRWFYYFDNFSPLFLTPERVMERVYQAGGPIAFYADPDAIETLDALSMGKYPGKLKLNVKRSWLMTYLAESMEQLINRRRLSDDPLTANALDILKPQIGVAQAHDLATAELQLRPAAILELPPLANVGDNYIIQKYGQQNRPMMTIPKWSSEKPRLLPLTGGSLEINQPITYEVWITRANMPNSPVAAATVRLFGGSQVTMTIDTELDGTVLLGGNTPAIIDWRQPQLVNLINNSFKVERNLKDNNNLAKDTTAKPAPLNVVKENIKETLDSGSK